MVPKPEERRLVGISLKLRIRNEPIVNGVVELRLSVELNLDVANVFEMTSDSSMHLTYDFNCTSKKTSCLKPD